MKFIKWLREWLNGGECFFCTWDNPRGATRTCLKCGRIEVMSHL